MTQRTLVPKDIDFTDLNTFVDGRIEEIFHELRENYPVAWHPTSSKNNQEKGFWILSRYQDIIDVWKNTVNFSSEYGIMLRMHDNKDPAAGKMMVVTDPPRHTQLRKLHTLAINTRSISSMQAKIHTYVSKLLDNIEASVEFDFTENIAAKLPVGVTCELMDIPFCDWELIANLTKTSAAAEDSEFCRNTSTEETLLSVNKDIFIYFLDLIHKRQKKIGDDLISHLIKTKIDNEYLTEEEIILNCFSLLIGGNETTKYASAGGLYALIKNPSAWNLLKKTPSSIATTVEEILRWTTPVMHSMRVATHDIKIQEQAIFKGETVTLWNNSANRDKNIFIDPFTFNINRISNRHLTFGWGPHHCLGAAIARLEIKILFQEIIKRKYKITLTSAPERVRSNVMAGYKHLPIKIH